MVIEAVQVLLNGTLSHPMFPMFRLLKHAKRTKAVSKIDSFKTRCFSFKTVPFFGAVHLC